MQLVYDFGAKCYNSEERFAVFFNFKTTFFYCCNQTMIDGWEGHGGLCNPLAQGATASAKINRRRNTPITRLSSISRITDRRLTHERLCSVAGSIEDIFLSCSEPKRNVVEPSLVSVGTATMIRCRRCRCWCVQDVRLQDCYAQVTPGLAIAVKMHAGGCCANVCRTSDAQYCGDGAVQSPKGSNFGSELLNRWG